MSADILLPGMLQLALPRELDRLARKGGPTDTDLESARAFAVELGGRADILLYRGGKRGDTAAVFAGLVRALAVMAYAPGGVTLRRFGMHICAGVPDSNGATCHATGGIRCAT